MSRSTTYYIQECPTCGRSLHVRVEYLGKQVVCQHCHARFEAYDSANTPPPGLFFRVRHRLDAPGRRIAGRVGAGIASPPLRASPIAAATPSGVRVRAKFRRESHARPLRYQSAAPDSGEPGRQKIVDRSWPCSQDRWITTPGTAQSHQRQAHRHAVVVVGVDLAPCSLPGTIVRPSACSSTVCAELAQFGRQGADAIGFLVANVRDAANPRRPLGEQGHRRQRLHRIADGVHVDVDSPQRARRPP